MVLCIRTMLVVLLILSSEITCSVEALLQVIPRYIILENILRSRDTWRPVYAAITFRGLNITDKQAFLFLYHKN